MRSSLSPFIPTRNRLSSLHRNPHRPVHRCHDYIAGLTRNLSRWSPMRWHPSALVGGALCHHGGGAYADLRESRVSRGSDQTRGSLGSHQVLGTKLPASLVLLVIPSWRKNTWRKASCLARLWSRLRSASVLLPATKRRDGVCLKPRLSVAF